ncbi:hypothetical protein BDP27DRAFT_1401058, partial [Rhodocollybia butyracea]
MFRRLPIIRSNSCRLYAGRPANMHHSKYNSKEHKASEELRNKETYKSIEFWKVEQFDPRGEEACFINTHLNPEYTSYDPPKGFTAEQIMRFEGAKDVFESVNEIEKIIRMRDELGTLDGDFRKDFLDHIASS